MDFDPDEIERKNSHHAALASLETSRGKLNLIEKRHGIALNLRLLAFGRTSPQHRAE